MSLPSNFFKSTGIYAIANVCNKAVGFLMLPLYTSFLTPEDYGVVALLVFALAIFQTLFGTRLGLALPKFFHSEKSENNDPNVVISSALILTTLISIILTAVLFASKNEISLAIFGSNEYALICGIFFTCLLPQSIEVYGFVYLRIINKASLYLYVSLAKLLIQVSLNIYFIVILKMGASGIVYSTVISSSIFGLFFGVYLVYKTGYKFSWTKAKDMILFCWPLWFSTLSALYIWTSNRYFVRIYNGLDDVGLIELAAKFASILIAIFWEPFMLYWSTERYNVYYQKTEKAIYQKTFEIATCLLAIGALGICLFSDSIIKIMAAESFHQASILIPALVFGSLFYALSEFNNLGFMVKNKTKNIAYIDLTIAILLTVLYIILIPKIGIIGASIAMLLAQITQYIIYKSLVKKHFDMELKTAFLGKLLVLSLIAVAIEFILRSNNVFVNIGIQLALFTITTAIIAYLYAQKNPASKELIKRLIKK